MPQPSNVFTPPVTVTAPPQTTHRERQYPY
jgi:hypothetical protein